MKKCPKCNTDKYVVIEADGNYHCTKCKTKIKIDSIKIDSINIDMEIKAIGLVIDIAVKTFEEEIEKADLSDFHKKIVRGCFVLGLVSSVCVSMHDMIARLDKHETCD